MPLPEPETEASKLLGEALEEPVARELRETEGKELSERLKVELRGPEKKVLGERVGRFLATVPSSHQRPSPSPASATLTRVLFWGSTAAGAVRASSRPASSSATGLLCQAWPLGAPLGASKVPHLPPHAAIGRL